MRTFRRTTSSGYRIGARGNAVPSFRRRLLGWVTSVRRACVAIAIRAAFVVAGATALSLLLLLHHTPHADAAPTDLVAPVVAKIPATVASPVEHVVDRLQHLVAPAPTNARPSSAVTPHARPVVSRTATRAVRARAGGTVARLRRSDVHATRPPRHRANFRRLADRGAAPVPAPPERAPSSPTGSRSAGGFAILTVVAALASLDARRIRLVLGVRPSLLRSCAIERPG